MAGDDDVDVDDDRVGCWFDFVYRMGLVVFFLGLFVFILLLIAFNRTLSVLNSAHMLIRVIST